VFDGALIVLIFGGFYGFLYPVVVGATLALCAIAERGFRPRPRQWVTLALPGAAYYLLAYLVSDRQGWNLPLAVLALAGFASAVVLAACIARRPAWLPIGAAAGVCVAMRLWWLAPHGAWDRLF
jgi:hypothetical protein